MKKRVISLLVAAVMSTACFGGMVTTAADTGSDSDVMPLSEFLQDKSSELTITGTTAKCYSKAIGYPSETTKIVVNQTLHKKTSSGTWQFIAHWNETDTGYRAETTNYQYNLETGIYRLTSGFTVMTETDFETIIVYSTEVTLR